MINGNADQVGSGARLYKNRNQLRILFCEYLANNLWLNAYDNIATKYFHGQFCTQKSFKASPLPFLSDFQMQLRYTE